MIRSQGPPDKTTPGNVGDLYQDTKTGRVYRCEDVVVENDEQQFIKVSKYGPGNEYTWRDVGKVFLSSAYYFCNNEVRLDNLTDMDTSKCTNFAYMFNNCRSLTTIPELNTSQGTNFANMFYNCNSLTTIPELNTSQGTSFTYMFYNCNSLTSIPELNTSQGTNFAYMFYNCNSLTSIPELNTSQGTSFTLMFAGCSSLTSIPELNTSQGTSFTLMFAGCSSLTSIPELNTSQGTNFAYMFAGCSLLTSILGLDIYNATSQGTGGIIQQCSSLTNLKLYNIKQSITIGSGTSYGHLLTVDSLVHTIKELVTRNTYATLTIGSANLEKIADLYCKVTDGTTTKKEMELCDSSEEGAMTLSAYAALKKWYIK